MSTPEPPPPYSEIVLGTAPWCVEAGTVFHGKTADEVFGRFFSGGGGFMEIEGLAWVAPPAFRYYIRPVLRYCLTLGQVHDPKDGETTDPDSLHAVAGILSSWLNQDPAGLAPDAAELADFCRQVHRDFDRFGADPDIYVGLQARFSALESDLRQLAPG